MDGVASIPWPRCPRRWTSPAADVRPPPPRAGAGGAGSVGAARHGRRPRPGTSPAARSRSRPPAATTCCSSGPPGSGKTMLARRLPGILPPPLAGGGARDHGHPFRLGRPARRAPRASGRSAAPHHTASDAALVGGGSLPRPGEVSLAHNGVLFLDELPEFRRNVLEALRQPLEERAVTIARARGTLRLPARFQLVAAMNPCPCGRAGQRHDGCACTPGRGAALPAAGLRPAAGPHRPPGRGAARRLRRDDRPAGRGSAAVRRG